MFDRETPTDGATMPHAWWASISATLPAPWARSAALYDLRDLSSRGERLSRRRLAARWGWTEGAVRGLLRSNGEADNG